MRSGLETPVRWCSLACLVIGPCLASCRTSGPGESPPLDTTQPTAAGPSSPKSESAAGAAGGALESPSPTVGTPAPQPTAPAGAEGSAPAPATATPEGAATAPATEAPAVTGILPTAKRTAAGLPDPIPGYQAWFRLEGTRASPPGAERVHLPARQSYILLPLDAKVPASRTLTPPLAEGTTIVLESKSESTDYIESLSAMRKTKAGWQFFQYDRSSADSPFAPASTDSCSGCHASAPGDGVFARLVLR